MITDEQEKRIRALVKVWNELARFVEKEASTETLKGLAAFKEGRAYGIDDCIEDLERALS